MADTPFFADEFVGAVADLGTHVPNTGTGWNTSAGSPGTTNIQLNGSGSVVTADTNLRVAIGRQALGSTNTGKIYGQMTFQNDGSSANTWQLTCTLQQTFSPSSALGATVYFNTGLSQTELWAVGAFGSPVVLTWPGSPSALNNAPHTVRWELNTNIYSLYFDGVKVYEVDLTGAGFPIALSQPNIGILAPAAGASKIHNASWGRFVPDPTSPFWTQKVMAEETI